MVGSLAFPEIGLELSRQAVLVFVREEFHSIQELD
jgi:hypothetical protein